MKWSVGFRLWHWLHAAVILGLLGTVFLRKTFLGWRANSEILMQRLASFQINITAEQAKVLAKAIRARYQRAARTGLQLHPYLRTAAYCGGCHCRCDRREGDSF